MGEEHSEKFGAVHIELARRIDAVCRSFEADCAPRKTLSIEGYLDDIPEEGRAAFRAEIEALERELHQADETVAHISEAGAAVTLESQIAAGPRRDAAE